VRKFIRYAQDIAVKRERLVIGWSDKVRKRKEKVIDELYKLEPKILVLVHLFLELLLILLLIVFSSHVSIGI
jgi:hypothetical protein